MSRMSTCWMCTVWVVNVNTINSVNNELMADMKQFESTEYSPRLLTYSSLAKLDIQIAPFYQQLEIQRRDVQSCDTRGSLNECLRR